MFRASNLLRPESSPNLLFFWNTRAQLSRDMAGIPKSPCSIRFALCDYHKKRTPIPPGAVVSSGWENFDHTTLAETSKGAPAGSLTLKRRLPTGSGGSWQWMNAPKVLTFLVSPSMVLVAVIIVTGQLTLDLGYNRLSFSITTLIIYGSLLHPDVRFKINSTAVWADPYVVPLYKRQLSQVHL